jgi:MFS family permease
MIAELLSSSGRGQTYGRYRSVVSMGGILGPILGGYLTNAFSYAIPFYIYAGVGIISLIAVLYMKVDGEQTETSSTTNPIKTRDLMTKTFLGILIIRMLYIFNFIFRQDTLPIYLNESSNFNVSETEIGIYMGVVRFSAALSQLFLGTLTDRIGSKKMIISSLFLIGVTNIVMINITGTYPLYSLGLIQGISIAAANLSMMIYLISTMPKGRTGMVMGIYSEFENIGGLFSSPLIGMIYDNVGPSASVLFVTSIIISNSVLSVFLLRS